MTKKTVLTGLSTAVLLAACAQSSTTPPEDELIEGMANPASVFCEQQGGRLETRTDKEGNEYAICHLPDGTAIEEWEYYRQHHK